MSFISNWVCMFFLTWEWFFVQSFLTMTILFLAKSFAKLIPSLFPWTESITSVDISDCSVISPHNHINSYFCTIFTGHTHCNENELSKNQPSIGSHLANMIFPGKAFQELKKYLAFEQCKEKACYWTFIWRVKYKCFLALDNSFFWKDLKTGVA